MKLIIDIPDKVWNKAKEKGDLDMCGIELYERVMNGKPYEEPMRIIYLCDDHGCPGCEAGTNPDHECKHTTDIAHAKNFEAMLNEETGEVVGYYEKPEHFKPIAQVNITDEYQELVDEAAQSLKDQIENGELIVKNSCRPVIIHHNGRDFNGYFDISRNLLFGSSLAAEVANDFGFTWTEVEES